VTAWIRSAPATYVYLFTLCVTTWVLQTASGPTAHRLLLEQSTNLDRLEHEPVRVLVASAFWLPQAWELVAWAVLFTLVMAPAERWLGSRRFVLAFAAGHVGATLGTAAVLWLAIHWQFVAARLGRVQDVGASYGFFAVAAAFTLHIPRRLRLRATVVLWAAVVGGYFATEGVSTLGHAFAVLIGYACALELGRPIAGRRGSWPSTSSAATPARGSPSKPSYTK
jgi:hypothetical protein